MRFHIMKMLKILDAKETVIVADALNQLILQKLAMSPYSITGLSKEINIPALKLWRRIQRLMKARLVEVSRVEKVGNLEKKLYRATALRYDVSQKFFGPKISDSDLGAAFEIYAKIQSNMNEILTEFDDQIPTIQDPTDFAIYALMQAFVQTFEKPTTKQSIDAMKEKLTNFHNHNLGTIKC